MKHSFWIMLTLGWILTACTPIATPTAIPTAINLPPTETPLPPRVSPTPTGLQLETATLEQSNADPKYLVKIEYPQWNEDSPNARTFNRQVQALLTVWVNSLKENSAQVEDWRKQNMPDAFSSLDAKYTILTQEHGLLSILFQIYNYGAGAAHPNLFHQVLNFDTNTAHVLGLQDLFSDGPAALQAIATYCKDQLKTREGIDPALTGADPNETNYNNWNIQPDGILITFDPYQVAAYAVGPQTVLVPYFVVSSLVDSKGALAPFIP